MVSGFSGSTFRAARAQGSGLFEQEIVPVSTRLVDDAGNEQQVTVSQDEGIRPGTTLAGLAKLKPAFKPDGSTTAGESAPGPAGALDPPHRGSQTCPCQVTPAR